MTQSNDDIVFEDLHGVPDQHSVEVDLDADKDGIRRRPVDEPDDENDVDDDSDDLAASGDAADDELGEDDELVASGDEDEDEDDQPSSRNPFQKRLERERRAKLKARREAEEFRNRASELERQLQEQSQTISERERKAIDDDIANAQRDLKSAVENGDTDKQVELTMKLSELQAKKLVADRQAPPKQQSTGQQQDGLPKLAQTWMKKNADWFRQPGFERFTRAANRIDSELYQEGYDVNSRDYYQELDRRLSTQFPDMFDEKPGTRSTRQRDRRSTVASVDGASNRAGKRALNGRIELGADDFRVMRAFGLDPNDPAHLKEFAASRRERLAAENANRRGR